MHIHIYISKKKIFFLISSILNFKLPISYLDIYNIKYYYNNIINYLYVMPILLLPIKNKYYYYYYSHNKYVYIYIICVII